jgi:hypothetical protein
MNDRREEEVEGDPTTISAAAATAALRAGEIQASQSWYILKKFTMLMRMKENTNDDITME